MTITKLLIVLIISSMSTGLFADNLYCGGNGNNWSNGKYNNDLTTNTNMATFTTENNEKIIFSFNNCIVVLSKE